MMVQDRWDITEVHQLYERWRALGKENWREEGGYAPHFRGIDDALLRELGVYLLTLSTALDTNTPVVITTLRNLAGNSLATAIARVTHGWEASHE